MNSDNLNFILAYISGLYVPRIVSVSVSCTFFAIVPILVATPFFLSDYHHISDFFNAIDNIPPVNQSQRHPLAAGQVTQYPATGQWTTNMDIMSCMVVMHSMHCIFLLSCDNSVIQPFFAVHRCSFGKVGQGIALVYLLSCIESNSTVDQVA